MLVRARVDAEAYGTLFDHYLPRVYGFVARRVGDRASAEEITASTFQRGLEAIHSGTLRSETIGGWLVRVAANAIVDRHERTGREIPAGVRASDVAEPDAQRSQPLVGDAVATAVFGAAFERDEMRRALDRLTEPQRRVIVLKFFDDLTDLELCGALGVSAATLGVRLERALRALNLAAAGKGSGKGSHAA
jgi:RNA polymerase sigma-70 factor (ECF subfamily)